MTVVDFDHELLIIRLVKALKNLSPESLENRVERQSCYQQSCNCIASPVLDNEALRRERIRRTFKRSF